MSDRDLTAAVLASYASLASNALITVRRMQLRAEGEQVLPASAADRDRLIELRSLLESAWRGAQLNGAVGTERLSPDEAEPPVDDQLRTYQVFEQLVPTNDFETFVTTAHRVLGELETKRWTRLSKSQRDFAAGDLLDFLQRMTYSGDMVIESGRTSDEQQTTFA